MGRDASGIQHDVSYEEDDEWDDDIYIMVKCLYVCNVFAYFYV